MALTRTLSVGPLQHSALLELVVPVLKTYGLILTPTYSRREWIWSWCYTQRTRPKKIIFLTTWSHGLAHKHNNGYTTVLPQQEVLINKRKKSRQRLPQCSNYSFVLFTRHFCEATWRHLMPQQCINHQGRQQIRAMYFLFKSISVKS